MREEEEEWRKQYGTFLSFVAKCSDVVKDARITAGEPGWAKAKRSQIQLRRYIQLRNLMKSLLTEKQGRTSQLAQLSLQFQTKNNWNLID